MYRYFAVITFCTFLNLAQTAPDRNLTALRTEYAPSFVSDPDGRGTWSLLYSSIFTLVLCVWTAIHPNLPDLGTSEARKYRFKALWVVMAVFAPEIGVLTAYKQYRKATTFVAELSRIRDEYILSTTRKSNADLQDLEGQKPAERDQHASAGTDESAPLPPYSKIYGFYVLMGGLAVDVGHLHNRLQYVILTPDGVLELARKGQFFNISDAHINDKSKANLLAKGLVLLQITWTVLQCLSRKVVGLPLSILEVHILVHAGCALIMYVLWFNKPLDVDQPILLQNCIPDEIVALMLMQTYKFGTYPQRALLPPSGFEPAKRVGSRYGIWPSSLASESAYLVFNPNSAGPFGEKNPSLNSGKDPREDDSNGHIDTINSMPSIDSNITTREACTNSRNEHKQQSSNVLLTRRLSNVLSDPGGSIETVPKGTHLDLSETAPCHNSTNQRANNQSSDVHIPTEELLPNRLETFNGSASTTSEPDNQEFSITSEPSPGAHFDIARSISTGDFLPAGIGPNAYPLGEWRNDLINRYRPPYKQPSRIKQIPESVSDKLPLHQIDHTSVKYYCPITISLSEKDIRRWQLAAAALRKELPITGPTPSSPGQETPLLNFDSPGGTARGAYFAMEQSLIGFHAHYESEVFDTYWRTPRNSRQHVLAFLRFYNNCLEVDELKLGSISAVTMLPGLLYGALHLALWNYIFPSQAERLLWRISGIILIAIPVIVAVALVLRMGYQRHHLSKRGLEQSGSHARDTTPSKPAECRNPQAEVRDGEVNGHLAMMTDTGGIEKGDADNSIPISQILLVDLALVAVTLTGTVYIFSRIYIIVESFISLRHVPIGVYEEVGWSKYIPHL